MTTKIPTTRLHGTGPVATTLREVVDAVKTLSRSVDAQSRMFTVEFLAASTPVEVRHRLRAIPVGYLVIRRSAAITVYESATASADERTAIMLEADGPGVVVLLFLT